MAAAAPAAAAAPRARAAPDDDDDGPSGLDDEDEEAAVVAEPVEYDAIEVARMNARLKGVEFEDEGEFWKVLKVSFDAEHEEMVCFYHDAALGDAGTIDNCEYSSVDEVVEWIAAHKRREKRKREGLGARPPQHAKKKKVLKRHAEATVDDDAFDAFLADDEEEEEEDDDEPFPGAPPPAARPPVEKAKIAKKKKKTAAAAPPRRPAEAPDPSIAERKARAKASLPGGPGVVPKKKAASPRGAHRKPGDLRDSAAAPDALCGPKMRFKNVGKPKVSALDLLQQDAPPARVPKIPKQRPPAAPPAIAGGDDSADFREPAGWREAVWKSNLQPDFNVRVCECFNATFSASLRELDESNRSVQKSAESTSI